MEGTPAHSSCLLQGPMPRNLYHHCLPGLYLYHCHYLCPRPLLGRLHTHTPPCCLDFSGDLYHCRIYTKWEGYTCTAAPATACTPAWSSFTCTGLLGGSCCIGAVLPAILTATPPLPATLAWDCSGTATLPLCLLPLGPSQDTSCLHCTTLPPPNHCITLTWMYRLCRVLSAQDRQPACLFCCSHALLYMLQAMPQVSLLLGRH